MSLKNPTVPLVEINQQFSSLSKVITELSNQSLLARVLIPICRDISSLTDVIARIKQSGLKGAEARVSIPICRDILSLTDVIAWIKLSGLKGVDSQIANDTWCH